MMRLKAEKPNILKNAVKQVVLEEYCGAEPRSHYQIEQFQEWLNEVINNYFK